jgi:hypothetical protein
MSQILRGRDVEERLAAIFAKYPHIAIRSEHQGTKTGEHGLEREAHARTAIACNERRRRSWLPDDWSKAAGTVTGDSSVSLHTYISIVYNIYVFFVSIYIKSMRDNARPDQGKSALGCTLIGSGPTNSRQKCRLKDDIYAELKRYISLTDLIYKHEKGHWNRRPLYLLLAY